MNNTDFFKYIILSVLFFFFYSCIERININTESSPPRLVVYGYITTDTMQHTIRITRSSGFFEKTKPQGISNATVSISCDEGIFELKESPDESGLYLTSPDVYGLPGKTYTFHASIDFNGDGKTENYEATSYLPYPATIDRVAVIATSFFTENLLKILIWGSLPEENSHNFSFHLLRNNVILNDSLRGFNYSRDDYVTSNIFAALPVFVVNPERDKYKFESGDTIAVQIESITAEYAIFMQNAQQEMFGQIPLFGGPPANIETNIKCLSSGSKIGISGFFTAFSKDKAYTIY